MSQQKEQEIVTLPHVGQPRVTDTPQEADMFILDFLQKKGLIDPKMTGRTPTIPRMKDGHPDNIKGKVIVRDVNISEEMGKGIQNFLINKGLLDAPAPEKQAVPPELQTYVDKQAAKFRDIANFEPFAEVLPPKPGEKYPQVAFNRPTAKQRNLLHEYGDILASAGKEKVGASGAPIIPKSLQTTVQAGVDAIPKLLSGGYLPSWTNLLMDAVYPGSSEEFAKTTREHLKETLGYTPNRGLAISEDIGEFIGILPVFKGLGTAGTALAGSITERRILQSLIKGAVLGAPLGFAHKPEGQDMLIKRIGQAAASSVFFIAMDLLHLTASQMANILRWNKSYSGFAFSSAGRKAEGVFTKRPAYGPGIKFEKPGIVYEEGQTPGGIPTGKRFEGDITSEEVQAVYNKMKDKAVGRSVPEWTERENVIVSLSKGSEGWNEAIKNGYLKPFERKPGMMDIFRKPKDFHLDIPAPPSNLLASGPEAAQKAGASPQPPPSPEQPPVVTTPSALPPTPPKPGVKGTSPTVTPKAPTPVPVPKDPYPQGRRMITPENTEARRVIDAAIAHYDGDTSVSDEDLDLAKGTLEQPDVPFVGNSALQSIQERKGVHKFWAVVEPVDKEKLLSLAEISDRLSTYNEASNPIEWPVTMTEDGEFVIGGTDKQSIAKTVSQLNIDLENAKTGMKVTAGYGDSLEAAEDDLIKSKQPATETVSGTTIPAVEHAPIYHWTKPENVNKIFDEGFNTKIEAMFPWDNKNNPLSSKPEKGILYFTRDPERYKTADVLVGQGKGDKPYSYYNNETRRKETIPMAAKTVNMVPIEATFKTGARILILDSLDKYLEYQGAKKFRGSLRNVVRKAKKSAQWDALEVKHVPGQWEKPGYSAPDGSKDLFNYVTGVGGKDDIFVFNRGILDIPEMSKFRGRKRALAYRAAQAQRGRVGMPKNAPKIWRDIMDVTGNAGLKPMYNSMGTEAEEWLKNVPNWMKNRTGGSPPGEVIDELEANHGYNFVEEDLWSLLRQAKLDDAHDFGGEEDVSGMSEYDQEQIVEKYEEDMALLKNEGESDDAFSERMGREAVESGFGSGPNAAYDYFAAQVDLKRNALRKPMGEEPPEMFKVVATQPGTIPDVDIDTINTQVETGAKPQDGPDYTPTMPVSSGQKVRAKYGVDLILAWFNEGKLKYPYTSWIGDVTVREAWQNSLDAVLEALAKGETKEGVIKLVYSDSSIYFEDNGIGMSDVDIRDKLLMLHASGKRQVGRFGGMGIAKAVIFAPDPTARWTLHTRDNWFTHDMASENEVIGTKKKIQGTRIYVKTDNRITSPLSELYIKTTKFPANVRAEITYINKNGERVRKINLLHGWDQFGGLKGETTRHTVDHGNEMELTYYPTPELTRAGLMDSLNKQIVYRVVDPITGSKLTQNVREASNNDFAGCLVVDISSPFHAGDTEYPLTDSRMSLKWNMTDPIDKLMQKFSSDKVSALRAGVEKSPPKLLSEVSPKWNSIIKSMPQNPAYKRLISVAQEIHDEIGGFNTDKVFLPMDQYMADEDAGFDEGYSETPFNALVAVAYDIALRIADTVAMVGYKGPKFLFTKTIEGTNVESSWLKGTVGYNPAIFGSKLTTKGPGQLGAVLYTDVCHEYAHRDVANHGQEFDMVKNSLEEELHHLRHYFLDIAEAVLGKLDPDRFKIRSWAEVQLPPDKPIRVRKNTRAMLGQQQLEFITKQEENDVPKSVSVPIKEGQGNRGLAHETGIQQGGIRGGGAGLPGLRRSKVDRGGAELSRPSGDATVDKEGVGIREVDAEGVEQHKLVRLPPGKTLSFPSEEKPFDISDIGEGTGEPLELQRQKVKKPVPKPGERPALTEEQKELIRNEVVRLTKRPFFPKEWVGNSKEEIDDNIQNLFVWTMEHYNPAKGPAENFINKARKYFYRGRMPVGEHAKELNRLKAEYGGIPEVATEAGSMALDLPEDASIFAPESKPSRFPTVPERPEAREKEWSRQAEKINNIFREVAKKAATVEEQSALFKDMEGKRTSLEKMYYQILRRKLDIGDSYRDIAADLDISHEQVRIIFEERILPVLVKHPQINEMVMRIDSKMSRLMDPAKVESAMKGQEGMIRLDMLVPGAKNLKKFYDKWLSSSRGQSHFVASARDMSVGFFHAELFDMAHYAEDYKKWADKQTPAVLEHILKAYTGFITGGSGANDITNLVGIPQEVKQSLLNMRGLTDLATRRMILLGIPGPTAAATMAGPNAGKYIERRYRAYEEKKGWEPTIEEMADIKQELMTNPMSGLFTRPMTAEEADKYLEEAVDFIRARVRKAKDYSEKSKLIDQHNLLHKASISPAWRKFLGEYTDLYWLAVDGYNRMASQIANAEFLENVYNHYGPWSPTNLTGMYTRDINVARMHLDHNGKPDSWINWHIPNDRKYGAFRNTYVPQHFFTYLTRDLPAMMAEHERFIEHMITMPYKWINTIGSLPTWQRNIGGDILMSIVGNKSVLNPLNRLKYLKAIEIVIEKNGKHFQTYSDLIRGGYTATGFFKTEIPAATRDILNPQSIKTPKDLISALFRSTLGKPIDKMGELYNLPDIIFRIAGKLINDDLGMSPQENIEDINATYPNYEKNPRFVDWLKRIPALGPFVSFRVNMIRIAIAQARIASTEMQSPDVKTKVKGMNRMWWLGMMLAGGYIAKEISKKVWNIDAETSKQLEDILPPWQRNKAYVYYRDSTGRVKMIDASNVNPFGEIGSGIKSFFSLDPAGVLEALNFFDSPIFDVVSIAKFKRDPFSGKEYENFTDQMAALMQLLYVPASSPIPDLRKLFEGHFGKGAVKAEPGDEVAFSAIDPETGEEQDYKLNEEGGSIRPGIFTGKQLRKLIDAYNNNPNQYQRIGSLSDGMISFMTGISGGILDPEAIIFNAMRQKQYELNDMNSRYRAWLVKHQSYSDEDRMKLDVKMLERMEKVGEEAKKIKDLYDKIKEDKFRMFKEK